VWAGLVQGLARGNGFGDEMMATVEKMPMLQEGYETLSADLKRLKAERPTIVDAIEASISDIEDKLSRAQIIDPKDLSGDKVVFGATVTLLDENDKPVKYQIVGQTEANAKTGRISYNSPLGRGLIGRKLDEEVEVTVPAGERYYVVSKIEFI
jgi:transcription elongation factor GreA